MRPFGQCQVHADARGMNITPSRQEYVGVKVGEMAQQQQWRSAKRSWMCGPTKKFSFLSVQVF